MVAFYTGSKPVNTNNEEDEFEKEMASELSATMNCLTTAFSKGKDDGVKAGPSQVEPEKIQVKDSEENDSEFYDDVYFDSDDSEVEGEIVRLTRYLDHKGKKSNVKYTIERLSCTSSAFIEKRGL